MNIIICAIGSEYADDWISRMLSKLELGNCVISFRDEKTALKSKSSKYATNCFFHKKMKEGDYSDFEDLMSDAPPVDSRLLAEMAPFESQVFWMMERCENVDFNTRWEHYISHLRFWNYIIEKLDIDVFFSITTSHEVYDYIIYNLCKIKGIKCITGFGLSYYSRYYLCEDIYAPLPTLRTELDDLFAIYKDRSIEEIVLSPLIGELYDYYTGQGDKTPYYMKPPKIKFKKSILNYLYNNFALARLVANIKLKYAFKKEVRYFWYLYHRICFVLRAFTKIFSFSEKTYKWSENKKYALKIFNEGDIALDFYNRNVEKIDYDKKYVYVALHMQPENSSSPLGGVYVDQALMIEMLSYYVPKDWIIYVKEHPKQAKQNFVIDICMEKASLYRSVHFYERIKKCNNVKFVSLKEDTFKIMSNAKAVATLTGTAGLEAVTQGIPCLMFGYSYMQYAPNVYPIRTNDDCKQAIDSIQKEKSIGEDYLKKIKIYFKALERYVFFATPEDSTLKEDEIENSKNTLANICSKKILDFYQSKL